MKILGFNFTKIHADKIKDRVENLKIGTKIDVLDILSTKADMLKTKEEILAVRFTFGLDYEPELAKIDLEGNIVLSVDPKMAKDILKDWKDKQMPNDFRQTLFNLIIRKAGLRAIQLEEEMNLPIHFQLPAIKIQEKKDQ